MEQDTNITTSASNNSGSSDSNGWKIATAIASIVAVCGIGFGVYSLMQSLQKDNQISDLQAQISNEMQPTDDIVLSDSDNSFELFSDNIDGNISFYAGDYGSVYIDNEHNMKINVGQAKTTLLEEENVALAYYINLASYKQNGEMQQFDGYIPYVYYITDRGVVNRIRVDVDTSASEKIDGCENIVSIISSSDPDRPVTMIDINGDICQDI